MASGGACQVEGVLSFLGVVVSCLGEAFPLEHLGQVAFPWVGPLVVSCLEEVPSFLEEGLLCSWVGEDPHALVCIELGLLLCWQWLLQQQLQLFHDPGVSSPVGMVLPLL